MDVSTHHFAREHDVVWQNACVPSHSASSICRAFDLVLTRGIDSWCTVMEDRVQMLLSLVQIGLQTLKEKRVFGAEQ